MRKGIFRAVLVFLAYVFAAVVSVPATQAAPGDFLFQWGSQHLAGALAVAVDGNDNVYVAMPYSIQAFNSSGQRIRKWGSYGHGDGQVWFPLGIAVDGSGTVYVADTSNNRVQLFDSNGRFLGKWSHPDWATNPPEYLAIDRRGMVYVSEGPPYGAIKVFDSGGNLLRQLERVGQRWHVAGLATDAEGNLYAIDREAYKVHVYGPDGKFMRTVVSDFYLNYGVAVDRSGNIYVSGSTWVTSGGSQVLKTGVKVFNSAGNLIKTFLYTQPDLEPGQPEHNWQPRAFALDSKGNLYTLDWFNDGLRVFDAAWMEVPQWSPYGARAGEISRPQGVATDSNGNVYETNGHDIGRDDATGTRNKRVLVYDRDGNPVARWTGNFTQTAGITTDEGGNVYVLDTYLSPYPTSIVKVFDSSGNFLREWGEPGETPNFYGIAIDSKGNFLISDRTKSVVQVYDKTGKFLRSFGQFNNPAGIAVDKDGGIYVVDTGNSRVQKFDQAYALISSWGGFVSPAGIAADSTGHVFVADAGDDSIKVFDVSGLFVNVWGSQGDGNGFFSNPEGVAVDRSGERVYVADTANNRIQVFAGYGPATFYSISGTVHQGSVTGAALAGATVSIGGKTATTDSSGAFSITGLAAGTYTVTISKSGYSTKTVAGYVINGSKTGVEFYLMPSGCLVTGTVREASAAAPVLAGATVTIDGKTAITSSTGTFSFTGIDDGFYTITISKAGYLLKKFTGYRLGCHSDVVFSLTPATGTFTLSGTVRDGSTPGSMLAGATVEIAGKTATTDGTGAFSITDIPPGAYTLNISKQGYVTKTLTGYVMDCNKGAVVFYLYPQTYSMGGAVREGSASGPGVAGATLLIAGKSTTTSSTGTFRLYGIPAGKHTLTISKDGYITKTINDYVISGNQSWVVFDLSR